LPESETRERPKTSGGRKIMTRNLVDLSTMTAGLVNSHQRTSSLI
jgi:hypothetical protein